jgi:hypothetical protein
MEYLLGALVTLLSVVVINRLFAKQIRKDRKMVLPVTQSFLHKFLSEYEEIEMSPAPKTQSSEFVRKQSLKVMILEDEAYWIQDNQLYVARYESGEVNDLTTEKVDTISMDPIQLKRTMFIVEKLTEGNDDSGSSGK